MLAIQSAKYSVVAQQQQFTAFEIDYGRLFHHQQFPEFEIAVLFHDNHIANPLPVLIQNAPVTAVEVFVNGSQRSVLMGSGPAYRIAADFAA